MKKLNINILSFIIQT